MCCYCNFPPQKKDKSQSQRVGQIQTKYYMILAKLVDILQKSNFNKPLLTILHGSPRGRRGEEEFLVLCVRRRCRHTHIHTHTHNIWGVWFFKPLDRTNCPNEDRQFQRSIQTCEHNDRVHIPRVVQPNTTHSIARHPPLQPFHCRMASTT